MLVARAPVRQPAPPAMTPPTGPSGPLRRGEQHELRLPLPLPLPLPPTESSPTSSMAMLRVPSPRPNERLALTLAPKHHAWLAAMGAEHYYGYASHQKALRDLLLWAEAAEPEDVHWMFTTTDRRIAHCGEEEKKVAGRPGLCGCEGSLPTARDAPADRAAGPDSAAASTAPASPDLSSSSSSASVVMSPALVVDASLLLPQSSFATPPPTPSLAGAAAAAAAAAARPVAVNARVPHHVCHWLLGIASKYTNGDMSIAVARLCCVARALQVPQDIFNVRDDELLLASSADMYAMIGRDTSLGDGPSRSRSSLFDGEKP